MTKSILRQNILKRDNFQCVYCGASSIQDGVKLHLDHVIPVVYGGSNTASNVITACASCNLTKNASTDEAALVLPEVQKRNKEWGIDPRCPVETVREKNDPRKIVSIRLSEEDEAYCQSHGENASAFIRSLIEYHKRESHRREQEQARFTVFEQATIEKAREALKQDETAQRQIWEKAVREVVQPNNHFKTKPRKPDVKITSDFDFELAVRDIQDE